MRLEQADGGQGGSLHYGQWGIAEFFSLILMKIHLFITFLLQEETGKKN